MSKVKLQVPMDKELRDELEKRALSLGFDSAQAYIRVWAKAETGGRHLNFGEDSWGEPSPEALARLDRLAQETKRDSAAGKLKAYTSCAASLQRLNEPP